MGGTMVVVYNLNTSFGINVIELFLSYLF